MIEVRMLRKGIPGRSLAVHDAFIDIRKRPKLKKAVVFVVPREIQVLLKPAGTSWCRLSLLLHGGDPTKSIVEAKRAVVVPIVAYKHVGASGLWRGCLECRMRVNES